MPTLTKGRIQTTAVLTTTPTELSLQTTRLVQIRGSHGWNYAYDPDGPFIAVTQQEIFQIEGYVVSLVLWVKSSHNAVLTIETIS